MHLFVLFPSVCLALSNSCQQKVVINEIAWMGDSASYKNEWIELKNRTNSPININSWKLVSKNGLNIELRGTIQKNGFFLLSRNQPYIQGIKADVVYKGSLNNKGDDLMLFDKTGRIIDRADFLSGWPAGNNKSKQTMERIEKTATNNSREFAWQTSRKQNGTPKAKNSKYAPIEKKPVEKKNINSSLLLADASNFSDGQKKGFYTFFEATAIAFLSAFIVLILKKKEQKVDF